MHYHIHNNFYNNNIDRKSIEDINKFIEGEILYDDNLIMNNNQTLGNNIIIQKENANDLFSKSGNIFIPSEFKSNDIYTDELDKQKNQLIFSNEDIKKDFEKKQRITEKYKRDNKIPEDIDNKITDKKEPDNYLTNNYIGQFYFTSLTIVGLYILFRMTAPNKKV
jgi:predicted phage-related endonuclease